MCCIAEAWGGTTMVLFALARCWMQRRGGSCRTRCGGTRPSPHSRAFLVSLVQSSSQTRCHAIIAASITEAEPFRAGVQESVGCERIGHLTVMQALLHTRRWHSRRVCKPMRIVRQPAGRPQRRRRQSASQQQQQATTCLHDNILHALLSLAQHPSPTGCPTRLLRSTIWLTFSRRYSSGCWGCNSGGGRWQGREGRQGQGQRRQASSQGTR